MQDGGGRTLDAWLAVLAGPGPWADGQRLPAGDRLLLVAELAMAIALGLVVVAVHALDSRGAGPLGAFVGGLTLALGATLYPAFAVVVPLGRHPATRPAALALVRAAGVIGLMVVLVRELGPTQPVASAAVGVMGGAEAAVTLRAIGITTSVRELLRRFTFSAVHLGAVTALAAVVAVTDAPGDRGAAVRLVVTFYAVVATGMMATAGFGRALAVADGTVSAEARAERAAAHRHNAHWLHDDVCSHLTTLRQRLEAGALGPGEVISLIDEVDHRLRLRQVEEILAGGTVRLAELVQPYIRFAQNHGVTVADAPSLESAALSLGPASARLVQRACAVLVSNAVQAGATRLALRTTVGEDRRILVVVEDDAGGIDVADIVPGRGLDELRRELGESHFDLSRTAHGTRATVSVAIDDEVAVR